MSIVLPPPPPPPYPVLLLLLLPPSATSAFTFLALFLAAFLPLLRRTLRRRRRLPASPALRHPPRRLLLCKSIPSSLDKLQYSRLDPILLPGLDLFTCVLDIPALRRIASASQLLDAAPRETRRSSIGLPPLPPPPGGEAPERIGAVVGDERRFRRQAVPDRDSEEAEEVVAARVRTVVDSADFTASYMSAATSRGRRGVRQCAPSFEKQLGWDKVIAAKAGEYWRWQGAEEYDSGGGGAERGVVRLWSAQQAALLQGSLGLDPANVSAVRVSADHATFSLADAGGHISVWDMATASCVLSGCVPSPPPPLPVSALCIDSERGLVAAAVDQDRILVSDIKSRATMNYSAINSRISARDVIRRPSAITCRGDSVYVLHSGGELVLDMRKMQEVRIGETGIGRLEMEEWGREDEEEEVLLWERLRSWSRTCGGGEEEEEDVAEVERRWTVSTWCAGLLRAIGVAVAVSG